MSILHDGGIKSGLRDFGYEQRTGRLRWLVKAVEKVPGNPQEKVEVSRVLQQEYWVRRAGSFDTVLEWRDVPEEVE